MAEALYSYLKYHEPGWWGFGSGSPLYLPQIPETRLVGIWWWEPSIATSNTADQVSRDLVVGAPPFKEIKRYPGILNIRS